LLKDLDVKWAAGFFEGEGYAGFKSFYNKIWGRYYPRLTISISQVHKEPLEAFRDIFSVGVVRGPYGPYTTTKQAYYAYHVSGDKAALVIEAMLPFLFQKGIQAKAALDGYNDYQEAKHVAS
jgi:hypothetical protein